MIRSALLLILLMACAVLVVSQIYIVIPMIGNISAFFNISPEKAALTGSSFGLFYAIGFLVLGPLSDRYGRKLILVSGLATTALATALVGLAPNFELMLAARALQGFVAATFAPVAFSLIAEVLSPRWRTFGISSISFAFLCAAPLAQFFVAHTGGSFATAMFQLAPFYMLTAIGLFFTLVRHPTLPASQPHRTRGQLIILTRDRSIRAAWGATTTVLFSFFIFHAAAHQTIGIENTAYLQQLRLLGLPPLLLTFTVTSLTRRFGSPLTSAGGLILILLAFGLAATSLPSILFLSSILNAAGVAIALPGLIIMLSERATTMNRGLALSIYSFCLFIGVSLAPPLVQLIQPISPTLLWLIPFFACGFAAFSIIYTTRFCHSPKNTIS